MHSINEIESAIESLPAPLVDELAHWLDELRARRVASGPIDRWLDRARGAAVQGVTTASVMALSRGDE